MIIYNLDDNVSLFLINIDILLNHKKNCHTLFQVCLWQIYNIDVNSNLYTTDLFYGYQIEKSDSGCALYFYKNLVYKVSLRIPIKIYGTMLIINNY